MRNILFALAALCLVAGTALAGEAVGQFTEVSGDVRLESAGQAAEAAPLARIREGDLVRLGAGATASLAWFESDREETWTGPGSFVVGRDGGQGQGGFMPARVAAEPGAGAVPAGLSKESLNKGGQLMIRGAKKPKKD